MEKALKKSFMSQVTEKYKGLASEDFTQVPHELFFTIKKQVGIHASYVWFTLLSMCYNKPYCFPCISTLAEKAGVARSTLYEQLTKLEDQKILKRIPCEDKNGKQTSNVYLLNPWFPKVLKEWDDYGKNGLIRSENNSFIEKGGMNSSSVREPVPLCPGAGQSVSGSRYPYVREPVSPPNTSNPVESRDKRSNFEGEEYKYKNINNVVVVYEQEKVSKIDFREFEVLLHECKELCKKHFIKLSLKEIGNLISLALKYDTDILENIKNTLHYFREIEKKEPLTWIGSIKYDIKIGWKDIPKKASQNYNSYSRKEEKIPRSMQHREGYQNEILTKQDGESLEVKQARIKEKLKKMREEQAKIQKSKGFLF